MSFLLDTHCWLWLQTTPKRISSQVLERLEDPSNELFLSVASSWEIAIKWSIGKLPLPEPPVRYVPSRMERHAVKGLAIEHHHALRVADLPHHHGDPFDRLLIAQAQMENLRLVTVDSEFQNYEVKILWAK